MDLITLGIPIYNVEECVEKSLLSALNQTYSNIEYLIVDDKGTDNSMNIVRKTVATHSRGNQVKIIENPQNLGIGETRNVMISQAKGKYLFFLDSDDEITPDCIQKLHDESLRTNADIVSGSYQTIQDGKIIAGGGGDKQFSTTNREEIMLSYFNNRKFFTGVWNKLYNTTFLLGNNIRYRHQCIEDIYFSFIVAMNAQSYSQIPDTIYHYIKRANSMTGTEGHQKEYLYKWWVSVYFDSMQYLNQMQINTALRIKIKKKLFAARLYVSHYALINPYNVQHYINDFLSPSHLRDKDTLKSPILLLAYIFSLLPLFIKKQGVRLFAAIKKLHKR